MQALIGVARSRVMLLIAAAGAAGTLSVIPVQAQDDHSIYYGSRAGMHVTTVSKSGIGTSNAVIMIKHTPKDAKAYCVEYEQDYSMACVKRTMASVKVGDRVTANCKKGTWTDVYGEGYVLEGKSRSTDLMADYVVRSVKSGEVLDGSSASGYPTALSVFQELCPGVAE
ncbi:hypothetical protein GB928_027760 [Shinella curvata]|uniref:Uncharacterized protein n=1 Tax=Shinella curvata TaxID=1817964 RepID=A0ABT8XP90_9HYPH|nr:hypothetical protein [Shinella curvata]MCJ8057168.1 hypothetical protein [Shinella curvata]MDO6124985.1 hypothetical protein [Shinella curvata]